MKRLFIWLPILAVLLVWRLSQRPGETTVFRLPLSDNWTFHAVGDSVRLPAVVPGCVHLDLLRQGRIDDPFLGTNEEKVQWVGKTDWVYENQFEIDGRDKAHGRVRLRFEGLDTHALVTLNDFVILRADNMFRTWDVDVKEFLRVGPNTLRIQFHSSVKADSVRAAAHPIPLPEVRVFSRKAPYQSGWDWGPTLVTCGVWRPVTLEAWDGPKIELMQVIQQSLTDDKAELRVRLTVLSDRAMSATFDVVEKDGKARSTLDAQVAVGESVVDIPVTLDQPKRWWTHDQGAPHLYTLSASLKGEDGVRDRVEKRIGLRTVEVVQKPDSIGSSFEIHLNGRPVFMKGANVIPLDSFIPRVTDDERRDLVASAKAANMNMLRIWGGGVYPSDSFYDFCDEAGILIWQDFMFACAMYPGDSTFVQNVRGEAEDNIRRLRHHPSLALWCGNNEVDEAFHNWGWQQSLKWTEAQSAQVWADYEAVFHQALPQAVAENDPGAFYWPSSPKIGWGHAEGLKSGDMHYWGVWWGKEPFEVYDKKVGRFMSEYGFQGMPAMETLATFSDSADRHLGLPVLKTHQKHPFGDENIAEYMARDFPVPQKFEDYVYVSQCLQADGIGRALEAHRRAKPVCMGTLYWQLNDCWPVTSWSSLDDTGRWKALHFEAKRRFAPVAILHSLDENQLSLYLNNDTPLPILGQAQIVLEDFSGEALDQWQLTVQAEAGGNARFFQLPLDEILRGHDPRATVLHVIWTSDQGESVDRLIHLVQPKAQSLNKPEIQTRLVREKGNGVLILKSNTLARYVRLATPAPDIRFEDNFFDLGAHAEKRIALGTGRVPEDFLQTLTIQTLAGIE